MEDEGKIFLRESTGLVKEAGFWDAVSINIANMSAGAALGTVGFTLMALPSIAGVNLVYASIMAFLLSIPQIIVYTILTTVIPRTGGDYVWLTRALGPRWAWLSNGLVMAFVIQALAYYALVALAGVAQLTSVLPVLGMSISLSTPEVVGIAISFFAVIVLVNILGTRYGIRLMTVLTTLSILGLVTAILVLFLTPHSAIVKAVNSLLPSGYSYKSLATSYRGPTFTLSGALMVIPFFALYVYPWLMAGPAIASEIRGRNALRWNVPLGALLTMGMATLGFASMYYALGFGFTTEALSNPSTNSIINFWTVAMVASGNKYLEWFLGIVSVLWYLAILAYGAILVVRYWFALAFDRVWPSFFAYLSPRFGTPIYAHLIDLLGTSALIAAAGFLYNTFTALYGTEVGPLTYLAFVGIAAVVLARRRGDLGRGSRALLTIAGALQFAVFVYLVYEFLAYPSIWGGNWLAYGVEIGAFVLGVVAYFVARHVSINKYGLDISVAYQEIPPE
ncbi:APC family permease [Vulcanisaeta thermophila]|uniref:APC family permease n=1 Tax=Vulcanisaeta thermophila TaxID=867917 RepID=UPI0008539D61|nr:APC family permease [Vulcanisaeta thermophila]